jgi:hypothetical protein
MNNLLWRLLPPITNLHVSHPYPLVTVTCHITPSGPLSINNRDNIPVVTLIIFPRPTDPFLNKTTVSLCIRYSSIAPETSYSSIAPASLSPTVIDPTNALFIAGYSCRNDV